MNNSLGKQFSEFLSSKDFDAANQIIKKARSLEYPHSLINSWASALSKLEPGIRHPLDSVPEPNHDNFNVSLELDQDLKQLFRNSLLEYCTKNNIDLNLVDKIVEIVDENIDLKNGTLLVPDLTSDNPVINLLPYSAYQYSIENPDIAKAVERGLVPSEIHHLLSCGYFEILNGRRYSSICFSHERKKYNGKLLYVVDDYEQLSREQISKFQTLQLGKFIGDVFCVKQSIVYTSGGSCLSLEQYLFQNISEYHNLCILLPNKSLAISASKWIFDIKLNDQTAIIGYSKTNGRFCSITNFSYVNMLAADITNGCIIVNPIDALAATDDMKSYKSAYGFYHALILQMHKLGVEFCLKDEILSLGEDDVILNTSSVNNACWSPFYWSISNSNTNKPTLDLIRADLLTTWSNELLLNTTSNATSNSKIQLSIDPLKKVVQSEFFDEYLVGVVIPFRDQIHLLADCVDSLLQNKEAIGLKIYAVNNDSVQTETYEVLDLLKKKYPDQFICIDSPGPFNFAKINNEAVDKIEEDYVLFLNNDILIESHFVITTLLMTHNFYNAIITGSKLLYPSGKIQHNGLATTQEKHIAVYSPFRGQYTNLLHELLSNSDTHSWDRTHECSAVTGACLLMRTKDFLSIGGFNEQFKVAYNDVDLCFRAKEKFNSQPIICCTDVKICHLESESRGLDNDVDKKARLHHERVKLVNRHQELFSNVDKFLGIESSSDDVNKTIKLNFDHKYIDTRSTLKSDIDLEELLLYKSQSSSNKKYACIFVHYDKDSLIPSDCVHHIEKLSEYCDVFFVSGSEELALLPDEITKVKPFCKQILIRKNSGYDFGCWSHVIRKNYSDLCNYEGVLLANDSNWGPLHDFSDTFNRINNFLVEADFLGLTSSITPSWHLQSFFVMYSRKVFCHPYFKQHWFSIGIYGSKYDIIMNYEVAWCTRLRRLGFYGMSMYCESTASNPTHVDWEKLLKSNYPYLKKELIRENPLRLDLTSLPIILSTYESNWQSWLSDYLHRHGQGNSPVAKSLRPY